MKPQTYSDAERVCRYVVQVTQDVRRDTAEAVASNNHIELIKHFVQVRDLTEKIKEARKAPDEIEEKLSREQVPEAMRAQGIKTITIEGIGRVSLANSWRCSINDGKKLEGIQYLKDTGNAALVIETVPWQTLAAFAKDINDNKGEELPSDLFTTGVLTYTSITKAG